MDRSLYDRCLTRGVVGSILPVIYGNGLEIHQTPTDVVIRYEMIHEARIVPLDGRPPVGDAIKMYMGDARGRFEGETLVVETANFVGQTGIGLNGNGPPSTPSMQLVERFTRVADDRIDYSVTVTDPETYTAPFTIAFPITPQPDYQVLPYECHEGNRALANILSAARADDRASRGGAREGVARADVRSERRRDLTAARSVAHVVVHAHVVDAGFDEDRARAHVAKRS